MKKAKRDGLGARFSISFVLTLPVVILLVSNQAFGWGAFGHSQISHAAVNMSGDFPLGACLLKNIDPITRLAIAPDMDWKMSPMEAARIKALRQKTEPLTDAEKQELELLMDRSRADRQEHKNHFFQIDSFLPTRPDGSIAPEELGKLPSSSSYAQDVGQLGELIKPMAATLNQLPTTKEDEKIDPAHLTLDNLVRQGTAPFRIAQFNASALQALGNGDIKKALFFLATSAHYTEDMYQPFHTSSIFNTPAGIHSEYEEQILESLAGRSNQRASDGAAIWDFSHTEGRVIQFAQGALGQNSSPMPVTAIIPEIYRAAASGRAYENEIQRAFRAVHPAEPPPKGEIRLNQHERQAFMDTIINVPGRAPQKVIDSALDRMGQATANLLRQWRAIGDEYQQMRAKNPSLPDLAKDCDRYTYPPEETVRNYPPPSYIDEARKVFNAAMPSGGGPPSPHASPQGTASAKRRLTH